MSRGDNKALVRHQRLQLGIGLFVVVDQDNFKVRTIDVPGIHPAEQIKAGFTLSAL